MDDGYRGIIYVLTLTRTKSRAEASPTNIINAKVYEDGWMDGSLLLLHV